MKTKPDGRRSYDLCTIGPVPAWWARQYVENQVRIRRRIQMLLAELIHPRMAKSRGSLQSSCTDYRPREVDDALKAMVADGAIEEVDPEYFRWKEVAP